MKKTGNEPMHVDGKKLDYTLLDFWQWSNSNLLRNILRGHLAEFIVKTALEDKSEERVEWVAYDLKLSCGTLIEIKSSAYIQGWEQKKHSTVRFGIAPTKPWDYDKDKRSSLQSRASDIYIFCVLEHKDELTIDPLNMAQWKFYVLRTSVLNEHCATQRSISLSGVIKLGAICCSYDRLKKVVDHFFC